MNEIEVFTTFASFVKSELKGVLSDLGVLYNWRKKDWRKTVEYRRSLSKELNDANASLSEREEKLREFVKKWGGINSIGDERIREFAEIEKAKDLVRKNKCIASSSKALSLWRPTEYFIYDSRVAIALHKMWGLCPEVKDLKCPFILCPSRSEKAKEVIALLRKNDKARRVWKGREYKGFYFNWYIKLITEISESYDKEYPEKVEMALFYCGGNEKYARKGSGCKKS